MRRNIVLVPFPFDDLTASKVRPALCLTDEIQPHGHVVLAFITSKVSNPDKTDLVLELTDPDFLSTGLKVPSSIRLHRLMTVSKTVIVRRLGSISNSHEVAVKERLATLFGLSHTSK